MAQLKDLLVEGKSRFIDKIYASDQFISKVVQGTPPFLIDSSTLVSNLNADLLDGYHAERLLHGAYNKSVVYDILEISRTDTLQEIIIKTKLPFTNGNEMPSIYFRGYAYGNSVPMNVHLVFYIYGGAFCNYSAVSYGAWNPRIFLFTYVEGGTTYVGIGLKKSVYYPRFWIDIADIWTSSGSRYHAGWTYEVNTSTSTTIIPTDNQKEVGYTSLDTSITGSASFATSASNADTVDGKHASDFATSTHTHSFITSAGFSNNGSTSLSTWGTLTTANGYTGVLNINDPNGGSWEVAYKGGQQFHQIDGYYYQNEGRYRVTDVTETVTALGTSENYLTWTKNGSTNNITVPYATASNTTNVLNVTDINTETDITESGIRGYSGGGSTWTGSISSMTYAAILTFGNPSRGWQLWAQRATADGMYWRRGNSAATAWEEPRLFLDSSNYTSYTVTKTGGGASGTWGINITGTAAGLSAVIANDKLPTRLRELCTAQTIADASLGTNSGWAYVTSGSPFSYIINKSDYMLLSTGYNASWCGQIAENFYSNDIAFRTKNSGTWTEWAYPILYRPSNQLSNCNDVSTTGIWTNSGFSNKPSGVSNWGSLFNIRLYKDNNTYHRQLFFDCYGTDKIWTRSDNGGSWTSWVEIVRNTGTWGISITGNAATATKLGTATVGASNRPIYLNAGVPTVTNPGEAFLSWGGQNFTSSFGPVDAGIIPELGANRAAFIAPSAITVQYSTNGGSSWTDYGASDADKVNLFNGNEATFRVGKNSTTGTDYTNYRLRIIINTSGQVYTALSKFVIYISTNGSSGCWCTIDARLQSNLEANTDTWANFANQIPISGWSGYNVINTSSLTTYGNVKGSHYGQVRFTFGNTGYSSSYPGLIVSKIFCIGGVGWIVPSTMARNGHMYTYDASQNVYFPASVSATSFIGNASSATTATDATYLSLITSSTANYVDSAKGKKYTFSVYGLTGSAPTPVSGTGPSTGDGFFMVYNWNDSYVTQIAVDLDPTHKLAIRHWKNDASTWRPWIDILTTANYTSYLGYIGTTAVQASSAAQAVTGITALTFNGATSAGANYITGTAGRIYFGGNFHLDSLGSNATYINYYTGNNVYLVSGSTQGKVGIGTNSPAQKLHVIGSIYADSTPTSNASKTQYISAGPGYSTAAGKYGVKVVSCDQSDCQSGLGQDLAMVSGWSGWSNAYNLSIAGGNNSSDVGTISFVTHKVNSTTYRYLGGFLDNAGTIAFNVQGNALFTGSVGIGTNAPENTLDVNGISSIYPRGADNTLFKGSLIIKQQHSLEGSNGEWDETKPSYGIQFNRFWTSGSSPYGETACAGIFATVSSSWRGGLVFRTKNNTTNGGTHDISALTLMPSGIAKFVNTIVSKVAQGTAPIQVDSSTVSPNLNADYLDGEHAYELRSKPKNNSYIIFSSLPFLESGIGMFSSTPAVSMENAPEGLCYGPITSYKQYTSDFIAVEPGETVYGEIWAYRASGATGTAGTLYYGIQRYDRNKKPISANAGLNAPNNGYFVCSGTTVPADGTWHKYSNTHTIPTSHTVYSGSDGKGVYYIKVYVLVNYSAGTIPTYIGRFLLSRTVKIAETANSVSKMQTVSSTSANNHYLTFVDSNNSPAAEETVYTTSKTVIQPSTGNLITEGYVAMGTGRANSYIGSDAANNIWLHNSSGYAVVCDANVVRRGASLTTGQLGNSTYPWASVYGTNIYTRYVSIDSSTAGNAAHIQFNRASYNYIQIPTNGTLSVNINGAGSANSYFKIDSTGVYPGDKDASYNLGSASLRWKDFYTAKANVRQTASAALGIATSTPYKIGTAKKDINIETIANGSGTGINDGYAAGLTFGDTSAAYAGIYYQTSGSYGSRLIFATTSSYANGSYGRVIISNSGYVGIGTMSPSQLLHVAGTIYSSVAQGTAPLKVDSSTLVANLHSEFTDYASVLRDPTYHTLGSRRNSANITFADGGLHYYLATSSMSAANGKPDSDGHILHMAWDNSKWDAQLTLPTSATGVMQWRVQTNGTDASWSPWKTVIDSSNIGSQSVAYATVASKISDITTSDAASSTATWRRVWFSYNDNVTGRPAYSDNFTYQTSTGTLKVGKLSITGAAGNSWLGGQQDGPINLNNATNTGSYWPWIRQTNTGSSKYFSIGVLNTSFYIIGSASSRTDNGYDYGWSFNVANGWAYGNFQNADTVDGLHASDFARKIVAGTAIAMANASGTITVETNKIIPVTTTGTTAVTFNFTWNSPAACDEAHVIITGSGSSKTITIGNVNSDSTNTKKNNTAIKVTSGGYGEISILYFDSKYFIRAVGN